MALQFLFQFLPINLKNRGKLFSRLSYLNDFSSIGINRVNLNAHCQFVSPAIVNGPALRNEGNLDILLPSGQLVELLFFPHLQLKHPPQYEHKTQEKETREKDDPDLKPIDRFPFHRITITCSGLGLAILSSSTANFSIRA